MRKLRLFVLALVGVLLAPLAIAQVPGLPGVYTGNELVRITTVAGSTGNTTFNHLRNSTGYLLVGAGTSVTTVADNRASMVIATGAIATLWTVNFPNTAYDGQSFCIANSTATPQASLAVAVVAGVQTQTLAVAYTPAALAANARVCWMYAATNASGSTGTWYRTL